MCSQVEIKKAEPRDASKAGDGQDQWGSAPDGQWGMPGMGPPGMPGMGNMAAPGAMGAGGMVQTYQGWGTPPAQQG